MKRLLANCMSSISRCAVNGVGPLRSLSAFLLSAIDDRRTVQTPQGKMTIRTGNPIERWRADTLLSKEPETIDWLVRTISADSVFIDVGANIGVYSLYAMHLFPGKVRAICFEPEAMNFARLNQNILDNGFSEQALTFSMGLGAEQGFDVFHLSKLEAGRALHGSAHVDADSAPHRQGIVVDTLDHLMAGGIDIAAPTHLKIDVDGPELNILRGAEKTLRASTLRHVLIELINEETDTAKDLLAEAGFQLVSVGETFDGMTNHIFEKPAGGSK